MYIDEQAHGRYIRALGGSWTYDYIVGKDGVMQEVQRVNGGMLKDIEHIRTTDEKGRRVHVAVAVLVNGECYVGKAVCSSKDIYSRRHGYRLAVGRALKKAASPTVLPEDFCVDTDLEGRDLFRACARNIFGEEK